MYGGRNEAAPIFKTKYINMAKYRKKPVVIDAEQFTDELKDRTLNWAQQFQMNIIPDWDGNGIPIIKIPTLEGEMVASLGDWIIRGVSGEMYPCKPDIFEKTYEPVDE